jgi:hypothetical protein
MNYIKHLTGFFEKVAVDKALNPTHVSLYMSLFQFWNCNRFKNPISISRDELMRISKISSKATYHKCLKNLHSLGYVNYEPSYNPFKGSHVYLFNFSDDLKPIPKSGKITVPQNEPFFELVNEQAVNKSCTSNGTGTEQALVSYINNTNIPNISNDLKSVNLDEQAQNFQIKDNIIFKNETKNLKEKKSSGKKEEKEMPDHFVERKPESSILAFADYDAEHTSNSRQKSSAKKEKVITPKIEDVKTYFVENNFPEIEANKFFNYFSSNGWLVGGKTPMIDWQAAAQNWILNAPNFKYNTEIAPVNRSRHLNTGTDKDYSEPL